jgi:light-regulated signal transduction histidine kinase (bacteriophytochrome)
MFRKSHGIELEQIRTSLENFRAGDLRARVSLPSTADQGLLDVQDSVNATLEQLVESLKSGTLVLIHEMKYPFIAARSWMMRARNQLPPSILRDELDTLIVQLDEARAATEVMADISMQVASRHDTSNFAATDLAGVCDDVAIELGDFALERSQFIRVAGANAMVFGRDHLLVVATFAGRQRRRSALRTRE